MKRQTSRGNRLKIRKELWVALITCCLGLALLLGVLRSAVLQAQTQTIQAPSTPASSLRSSAFLKQNSSAAQASPPAAPPKRSGPIKPISPAPRVTKERPSQRSRVIQASIPAHNLSSTDCKTRPSPSRLLTAAELEPLQQSLPLSRFRTGLSDRAVESEQEMVQLAHPSNFGWRFLQDVRGQATQYAPIIVLHETVGSFSSTVETFQHPHSNEDQQVSYHTLIRADGKIAYLVPPDRRAYGAGNSIFINTDRQPETVQTNPKYPPSVNNFAYHISLETPEDGQENDEATHSGYTRAQYESLAWLVAKTGIPEDRITTHQLIDQSGSRQDPRSFNISYFLGRLRSYPKTQEIPIGCTTPIASPPRSAAPELS